MNHSSDSAVDGAGLDEAGSQAGGAAQVDVYVGGPDAAGAEAVGPPTLVDHSVDRFAVLGRLFQRRPVELVAPYLLTGGQQRAVGAGFHLAVAEGLRLRPSPVSNSG